MNLLQEQWIPVRRASGTRERIAPHQLTDRIDDDPIVSLDAPRADFNGALIQFLIGLVQTAWMLSGDEWDTSTMLWEPPIPEFLQERFAPLRDAFELDGDGPRFMQDRTLSEDDKPVENGISALLIEAPGEQALERNTDHFVKRDGVQALCDECTATALFALMTNAPSGGAGHRTSLRGGGPLTTLVVYEPDSPQHRAAALWRDVACNVLELTIMRTLGDDRKAEPYRIFPWLAPQTSTQATDTKAETQPLNVHPAHLFWAMPRRIRLRFADGTEGHCDVCSRAVSRRISAYITKNYGLNYKGPWRHPLSPYYRNKPTEPALPMHPQADGLGYRHWLGWALGLSESGRSVEPALAVQTFREANTGSPFRLWAFGYDMDNMKARGWHEGTFPLFDLPANSSDAHEALQGIVEALLAAASKAVQTLRMNVRDAWFGNGETRGDLGFIDASFWSATEAGFFDRIRDAVNLIHIDDRPSLELSTPLRETWLRELRRVTRHLFDQYAASGDTEACHLERLAGAHKSLEKHLGRPLQEAVGLKTPEQSSKTKGRRGR